MDLEIAHRILKTIYLLFHLDMVVDRLRNGYLYLEEELFKLRERYLEVRVEIADFRDRLSDVEDRVSEIEDQIGNRVKSRTRKRRGV